MESPYPAEPFALMPVSVMFVGDRQDHRVGFRRQDNYYLDEMIGADVDCFNELPVDQLREYGQDALWEMPRRSHAHHLKTAFTGLVRRSIKSHLAKFSGPWVRISELLDQLN